MFISPTTHHARSVPRSHRSRAQYTHATIIAASSAHARRPKTAEAAATISLLTQVQTHRTAEIHPRRARFLNLGSNRCGWRGLKPEKLHRLLAHVDLANLTGDRHRKLV